METHGVVEVDVLDGESTLVAGSDFVIGENPEALAEPLIFGLGIVVSLLEGQDLADGADAAKRESTVSGESVIGAPVNTLLVSKLTLEKIVNNGRALGRVLALPNNARLDYPHTLARQPSSSRASHSS